MIAIDFPESNHVFNKPVSMDESECLPLSVYLGNNDKGMPYINSVWQPSYEDIEAIKAGRPVILSICGVNQPPVSLFTCNEKGEINQ